MNIQQMNAYLEGSEKKGGIKMKKKKNPWKTIVKMVPEDTIRLI